MARTNGLVWVVDRSALFATGEVRLERDYS